MRIVASLGLSLVLLTGCSQSPNTAATSAPATVGAPEQTATVRLKDGGTFTGTVKSSDSMAITLQSAAGATRTYPMTQVSSVNYATGAVKPSPGVVVGTRVGETPNAPLARTPAPVTPALRARPEQLLTVPAGVTIEVRNNEPIDSQVARPNQTFSAVVTADVNDDQGRIAVPRGANATLVVRAANGDGKIQGQSELVLDIASLEVGGRTYRIETRDLVEKGKEGVGTNKRTAIFTGGGAAVGSIIGAIAGGGKGAAIGAASGAAAGAGTQTLTRGKAVRVASETILRFTLEQPVQIRLVQ